MDDARVLLTDHNLVTLGGGLHQKVRPGQEKLARVRTTGHTEDELHCYFRVGVLKVKKCLSVVIMSALKSAFKNIVGSAGTALDNLITASRNALKRSSKVGDDVAAMDSALARQARGDASTLARTTEDAASTADNIADAKVGKIPSNDMPPSGVARVTKQSDTLSKYGITPTKVFAGISATVLASLALARLDATDGVKVSITDITIIDANNVKITYTSPGRNFNPCVNDTFTFYPPPNPDATPTTPDLSIGGDKTVVQVIDGHTIVVRASLTQAGNSRYPAPAPAPASNSPAPAPAPAPAISWGKMTCHSDYENQLAGSIGEAVAFVAGAAAAAIVETGTALTPAAAQVLGAAAGGAAAVLSAGATALTPLANDLFGPILDFFGNFKWWILACCIILCLLFGAFIFIS